jgi:catechol 2,3-dioxygenase-like lactoylglutathione lyase family enzyme
MLSDALLGTAHPSFPKIRRLGVPAVQVRDLHESVEFYRDIVGFSVVYQEPDYALLRAGEFNLGLVATPAGQSGPPRQTGKCVITLTVEVEDVWSFYRHLRNRGVKATEPRVMMHERQLLTTEFTDLNGICWALTEPYR